MVCGVHGMYIVWVCICGVCDAYMCMWCVYMYVCDVNEWCMYACVFCVCCLHMLVQCVCMCVCVYVCVCVCERERE